MRPSCTGLRCACRASAKPFVLEALLLPEQWLLQVGAGEVIQGWDKGILGTDGIPPMKVHAWSYALYTYTSHCVLHCV